MDSAIVEVKKGRGRGDIVELPRNSVAKLSPKRAYMVKTTALALVECDTKVKACEQLGISNQALVKRLNTYPQIHELIEQYTQQTIKLARTHLFKNTGKGAEKLVSLMDANSENVQLQASIEILDRAGIVKPQSQNNIQVNVLNQLSKDKDSFDL